MTKFLSRFALIAAFFVAGSHDVVAQAQYGEGTWTVAARAGIAPAVFSKKGKFTSTFVTPGTALPASETADIVSATTFQNSRNFTLHNLYKLPFTAGLDLGYFVCDNWEVFGNFNYLHACKKSLSHTSKGDNNDANNVLDNNLVYDWSVRDLSVYSFNLGSRYYICDWASDCFLPFVGAKLGIAVRNTKGKESVTGTYNNASRTARRESGKNKTAFTGAFQMGFDYMLDQNYALTFMSEVVGTSGSHFKSGRQLLSTVTGQGSAYTNVSKNPKGTLSFPITFGFRVAL